MKSSKIIKKIIDDPWTFFLYCDALGIFKWMDDEHFLKMKYKSLFHKKLNIENPQTFNEKIQWLKLFDHNPQYSTLVDKYEVRKFIANIIGEQYLIPLLHVYTDPEEINFDELPTRYVIKCNHNSGLGMFINNGNIVVDRKKIIKNLKAGMQENFYLVNREWPYKNVKKKILIEKYMVDESGYELKDYKIFVFNGIPQFIQVDFDRFTNHHRNFYDTSWSYVPFTTCYPTDPGKQIPRPSCLDEMLNIARKITSAIGKPAFCRIDLYVINNKIYFGEITFYHGAGFERFYPDEYDYILGKLIELRSDKQDI